MGDRCLSVDGKCQCSKRIVRNWVRESRKVGRQRAAVRADFTMHAFRQRKLEGPGARSLGGKAASGTGGSVSTRGGAICHDSG